MKPESERDIYDSGIEWLRDHPDRAYDAWTLGTHKVDAADTDVPACARALFQLTGGRGTGCGCLTQVARGYLSGHPLLTQQALLDFGIPNDEWALNNNPKAWERCAWAQRFLDDEMPNIDRGQGAPSGVPSEPCAPYRLLVRVSSE